LNFRAAAGSILRRPVAANSPSGPNKSGYFFDCRGRLRRAKKFILPRHSPGASPAIVRTGKGIKGYEIERANRAAGSNGIHFAMASGGSDSDSVFVFSAARLHLEIRKRAIAPRREVA
jgi:hypothetical protein